MLDNKTIIKVTNRDNGSVGYTIPDLNNLNRNFTSGETKEITMEELRRLSFIPGGESLIRNYLIIDNKEAVAELLHEVEPEYFYTREDVKNLLLNGSLDALKDCIDFAPTGTVDLVKQLAVELKIADIYKRKAILDMTGFDVTKAIEINEETADEKVNTDGLIRRLNAKPEVKEDAPTVRRTAAAASTEKYKIIK